MPRSLWPDDRCLENWLENINILIAVIQVIYPTALSHNFRVKLCVSSKHHINCEKVGHKFVKNNTKRKEKSLLKEHSGE